MVLPGLISLLIFLVLFVFFFRLMFFVVKILLVVFVVLFIFAAVNQDKFECSKINDETHCHLIENKASGTMENHEKTLPSQHKEEHQSLPLNSTVHMNHTDNNGSE
jgi:predicted RND superfamily exporter protein